MEKVHPSVLPLPAQPAFVESSVTFTIHMKSLILNSNGCTIYDSNGHVVYRVDNYDSKSARETYVMDHYGKVLVKICRKKFRVLGRWEGYRFNSHEKQEGTRWFKVNKHRRAMKDYLPSCEVSDAASGQMMNYKIDGLPNKPSYKIVDLFGGVVAEVKRKETASGVALSADVLNLVIAPNVDQSLIMGLVVVRGLMSHSL